MVRASDKVQLWRIGSRTWACQRAIDELRTLPLSLPKGRSKLVRCKVYFVFSYVIFFLLCLFLFHCYRSQWIAEGSVFDAVSLCFSLCMKYRRFRWTEFCQIHTEDVFGPSLRQVWRSKAKGQGLKGQKQSFSALSAACVRFMFGKTSLTSSLFYLYGG